MNRLSWLLSILLLTTAVNAADFIFSPINVSHGLSDNQIRYILQLPDGRMVFTTSGNLNLYDGSGFKYIHRSADNKFPLSKYDGYYRIYQSEDTLLWIKDSYKLMCVNLVQEKYISDLEFFFKGRGIKETVEDLFVDSKHQLWLLTPNGLLQYQSSEIFDLSANQGRLQDLITDNAKLYLFYSTGNIICYDLKTKKKLFTKAAYSAVEEGKFKTTSLVVKGQDGFYQLRNGSMGGFFFFDTQKLKWEKLLETDYNLNTLFVTQDDIAFISCINGFWIINHRTGNKQYLPELKTVTGSNIKTEVSTLFYDRQGGLWLGTLNQGLLYYHPSRYKFKYIGRAYFPNSLLEDFIVQAFEEDKDGKVYIKTQSQYYQMQLSTKDYYNILPIAQSSIPKEIFGKLNRKKAFVHQGNFYTDSLTDTRGWKWLGTQDGLILRKQGQQKEQVFYTEDGLSNNSIHAILEDQNQHLWVTTSYGISKIQIDPANQRITFSNYNPLDGTLEGEYADGAIFEASDGTLYFGGVNGFTVLKSDEIPPAKITFKPVFTNLFLRGEKITINKKYDKRIILNRATPYTREINLSYNQNFLTFEFSALNFLNPHQTRYRYQLKGIDSKWIETFSGKESFGKEGNLKISYTNLPPGEYILSVKASGNDNVWDGETAELKVIIHPPWWKTNAAYILYSIFIVLIVSLSIYLYTYFARKKIERNHREEILLLRIRNLIEQQKQLEAERESDLTASDINENQVENIRPSGSVNSDFISKAIALVEENLNEPNYSVEQLSFDLCMDRTGLYRKLKAELDKSPSLFIRSIRLQRAAQLILEGKLNIAEIAEIVGFSSSSYLSKCFQEAYGCRPTEYAEKLKKST